MQVISRRALREFWSRHPESREALLAWQRLIAPGDHTDFDAVQQLFKTARHEAPYVVFKVGRSGVRVIAVVHYSRRRVYVRHVFTRFEYEAWSGRMHRKDVINECLEIDAYALDPVRVANA